MSLLGEILVAGPRKFVPVIITGKGSHWNKKRLSKREKHWFWRFGLPSDRKEQAFMGLLRGFGVGQA